MKKLFENWRAYTNSKKIINEEDAKAANDELIQAQKNQAAVKQYTTVQNQKAASELASAKANLDQAKAQEKVAAQQKQATAKRGISTTTSTTPPMSEGEDNVEEIVGFQGEQEGSMGSAPVSVYENDSCDVYEGYTDEGSMCELELEEIEEEQRCNSCEGCIQENILNEAEYQGRKVQLGKKMKGDVKKYKVYVRNDKGNIVKVNFGDKKMRIKKSNPARRKSFRARHKCSNPGPRWKARYWSCKNW